MVSFTVHNIIITERVFTKNALLIANRQKQLGTKLRRYHLKIDRIRILRQSWDEWALIMNARLMRGPSRQEGKQI